MFDSDSWQDHEFVHSSFDAATGLKAIVAVHSTALGPACGGCRIWPYANQAEAMRDALRLAQGMSYKNALAGLPLGGGKAVIIADARRDKTPALMRAFGRVVEGLGGRYITAEDVGVSVADMQEVARETRHVSGISTEFGAGGDPSPFTARGVFLGIRAALGVQRGNEDMNGLRVLVQGIGNVGFHLCEELHAAGARLFVSDINAANVERAVQRFAAEVVPGDRLFEHEYDVFAPCALGAVINDDTVGQLRVSVIAGAANNQLARAGHGTMLRDRGIVYAPDYVINAGGIINVWAEIARRDAATVKERVEAIYHTTRTVLQNASASGEPSNFVADNLARETIRLAQVQAA